jgi:hypothetical protein
MVLRPELAARVFNTPLLMHPGKLDAALAGIGERMVEGGVVLQGAGERIDHVAFEHGRPLGGRIGDKVGRMLDDSGRQPFAIVDGVALIPIEGTLVHKGAYVGAYSGRTSYEGDPAICQRSRTRSAKPHGCHAVPPCERAWRKSG